MKKQLLAFSAVLLPFFATAQTKIGANPAAIDTNAVLELSASNTATSGKGFLLTRITTAQRNAIVNPATGLTIFNTTDSTLQYNFGTPAAPKWVRLQKDSTASGNNADWHTIGNAGTTPATSFIGTTDNQDFVIRTNNTEKFRIGANGFIGAGSAFSPTSKIDIVNNGGGFTTADDYLFTSYGAATQPALILQSARGTETAPASMNNGAVLGDLIFGAYAGGGFQFNSIIGATYTGNGTTNSSNMRLSTSGAERMRIDEFGNVGIGTIAAANIKLAIGGLSGSTATPTAIQMDNTFSSVAGQNLKMRLYSSAYGFGVSASSLDYVTEGAHTFYASGTTTPVERMRLLSNGFLSLGAGATPAGRLHLVSEGGALDDDYIFDEYNTNGDQGIFLRKARGSVAAPANLVSGDLIGQIVFAPRISGSMQYDGSKIFATYLGTGAGLQTDIHFATSGVDRMLISQNGSVGINVVPNTAYKLHVGGDINADGLVRSAGIALTSDARLKRNVAGLNAALASVMALRPVSYEKKATIESNDYNRREIGFIAQELRVVFPQLVSEGADHAKTLAVDYNSLIPVLTKAIQEQQAQIEALQKANAALATQNAKITAEVTELKTLTAEVESLKKMMQQGKVSAR